MSEELTVTFVTSPTEREAVRLARLLLDSRTCACVNIVSPIRSLYHWQGKVEENHEALLIIKTTSQHLSSLKEMVTQNHPYNVAEIVSVKASDVNSPYLRWVIEVTRTPMDSKKGK